MANTSTNKVLVILVIALLLTNLGMLYYFTRKKEDPKQTGDRQLEWVKKELKLTDAQAINYLALRQKRDSILKPLNTSLRESKLKMLTLITQPNVNDSAAVAVANEITRRQQPIEVEYYYHFKRIQNLCAPEQQPLLDSLLLRMINRNTGTMPRDSSGNRR